MTILQVDAVVVSIGRFRLLGLLSCLSLIVLVGLAEAATPTGVPGLSIEKVEKFVVNTAPTWDNRRLDYRQRANCREELKRVFACSINRSGKYLYLLYICRPSVWNRLLDVNGPSTRHRWLIQPGLHPYCIGRRMKAVEPRARLLDL